MRIALVAAFVLCAGTALAPAASIGARDGRDGRPTIPATDALPPLPETPTPAPAVACGDIENVFGMLNLSVPLASVEPLPLRMAPQVRVWLSTAVPKITEPFDLFFVMVHATGQTGIAAGWQKDPKTNQPSLCALATISVQQYVDLKALIKQREREEL